MAQKRKHQPKNSLLFVLNNDELEVYMKILRLALINGGYLSSDIRHAKFTKLFTNGKHKVKAIWKGNISELKYFVQGLIKRNFIHPDHVKWQVIVNCIEVEGKTISVNSLRKTGFPSNNRKKQIDSILKILEKHSELKKNINKKPLGILSLLSEN